MTNKESNKMGVRRNRLISLLLTAALVLTSAVGCALPAAAGPVRSAAESVVSAITGDEFDVIDTASLYSFLEQIDSFLFGLFGVHVVPQEKLEVVLDKKIVTTLDYVAEKSGLDINMIVSNFPYTTGKYLDVTKALNIDIEKLRAQLKSSSDKLYDDGNLPLSYVFNFLAMLSGGVEKLEVLCMPTNTATVWQLAVRITYSTGEVETLHSDVMYDETENRYYGSHEGKGMLDLGYDFDVETVMVYATVNAWMRSFGFCTYYDVVANGSRIFNYATTRVKFLYNEEEWMVQIWKGRYFIANGAEIGIYKKNATNIIDFYNCVGDEDMLDMSFELYHDDELLAKQEPQKHWWCNGFAISKTVYLPTSMTLKGAITLKDSEMLSAFCKSLDEYSEISYTTEDLTVSFMW